jgi:hypothetical protein
MTDAPVPDMILHRDLFTTLDHFPARRRDRGVQVARGGLMNRKRNKNARLPLGKFACHFGWKSLAARRGQGP